MTRTLLQKRIIVNVVVTTDLKQPVDLAKLTKLEDITYDPRKYNGKVAYFKSKKMQGKVTIFFSTGKLISVGTKSVKQANKELEHVAKSLAKANIIKPTRIEPVVRNMVISIDLGKPIDLVALCERMQRLIYEPEQFPAAIWRPNYAPRSTVLVFSTGKLIVTGNANTETVDRIERGIAGFTTQ
jgi:TATA-box binding protein (TBP) (component of TFIID and TFIIIB)